MEKWPRLQLLKFCMSSIRSGETSCELKLKLLKIDWLHKFRISADKLSPSKLTIRVNWFRRFHEPRSSSLLLISNSRRRARSVVKRTLIRLEVLSSMETKILNDQSDLLRRLEFRRNNLRSKTKSYVHELKPTNRSDHTLEPKQLKLWSTAVHLTLRRVWRIQNQVSEIKKKLKGILTPHLYYEQIEWGMRGWQIGMRPCNLYPGLDYYPYWWTMINCVDYIFFFMYLFETLKASKWWL